MKNWKSFSVTMFMVLIMITTISGCTSMPLTKDVSCLNLETEGIAIMSLKISNQYAPDYQPVVGRIWAIEWRQSGKASPASITVTRLLKKSFLVEETYEKLENQYNIYLISFQLPPGKYIIGDISGSGRGGFLSMIRSNFIFPLDAEFEVNSNKITYIGHFEMVNRKRNDGEPRSGEAVGFITEGQDGFNGGTTFDIKIFDRYDNDVKIFKETYPYIANFEVYKKIAVLIPHEEVKNYNYKWRAIENPYSGAK